MASAELAPYVTMSDAGETVAALSKTLSRQGHKVTVAMPRYPAFEEAGLMLARRLTPLSFEVGGEKVEALLFDTRLASGVELTLIDIPGLFEGPIFQGGDQDARRFGFFCRALTDLVRRRTKSGSPPDVVHAHDWSTALLPFLLRGGGPDAHPRTILTVHDVELQGRFPKKVVDDIGLSWEDFHPDGLEFYGDLNLLKAGIGSADVITARSPSHAADLCEADGAAGLDGVFRSRREQLVGIVGGIDYALWSPATDAHIAARYDAEDVANKGRCRAALLHELDLPLDLERPLVVSLGPVGERHGSHVLAEAVGEIVRTGARLVVAGGGDADLSARLEQAMLPWTGEAVFLGDISEPMRHRLLAAADVILETGKTATSLASVLRAQRYGAVPVACALAGLQDVVVDSDAHLETGTGFLFERLELPQLVGAVQRAVAAMTSPEWIRLRRRVMRLDVSWERPARRYARLYERG